MKTDEVVAVSAVVNSEDKDTKVVSDLAKSSVETKPEVVAPVVVEATNNRVGIVNPKKVNPPIVVETPKTVIPTKIESNPVKLEMITGVLEIMQDGQGFVRPKFNPGYKDAVIGSMQVRKYGLRVGDMVTGVAKAPKDGEKYWGLVRIDKINGLELAAAQNRVEFKDLVPIYPIKKVSLEFDKSVASTRIIDIFCPIGFGQRGMIVSPPKAGKTTLLKEIAAGVAANYPEIHLMAVLVGERPEEVTDMQRFIKGEVIASHFDQKPEEQTRAAEIAIERAKRLVEMGKDVFMVFDSITRLARAYNLAIPTSGRTLSGGFDPAALYPSKKFFGAARKIENGGSLTIIGTALVDTGSKMDELIFEEFKGTGNMELRLERKLAERRIFPSFDILKSGTRKEELLLPAETLSRVMAMRRMFDNLEEKDQMTELIIDQMNKTDNNEDFLKKVGKR
ncbi:MAG: Transcription termination factor Rho [Candidatus Shapirobacteria bacterium GW2011_GWE1_38_10]|uniref:Transcription termination factor Rho n=1 Tax=Candidatus Shapirobacteria bacterium GW2011_GWE1_38_10 TaxID=1618488 RepID=A0A0G0L9T5_9BACT|nr:MAG: Transcription termination factor Rho [Candidatus Shapirobacteria bacterium GW2011_GWF2_37_20]KKQ49436.1 MAG: Transcription termination factor Rho [Candidatus Shapirobacteria bacterium GW2011_GWE1_38_10]KKQ64705.1 MAG: Transcription termination factor Rho [Candidatus Shapirobacteria bacterium GW2011_GWF1_38_23]